MGVWLVALMRVTVSRVSGEVLEVEVEPSAKVADIKQHVLAKIGLSPLSQRLLYNGNILANAALLAECAIEDGACIELITTRSHLLTGCSDGKARLWDLDTGDSVLTLDAVGETSDDGYTQVTSVDISPDGLSILTGCMSGAVNLWSTAAGDWTLTLTLTPADPASAGDARWARFCLDGESALVAHEDGTLQLWNLQTGGSTATLQCSGSIGSLAVSCDGNYALTGCGSVAILWCISPVERIQAFEGHISCVIAVAFAPDGCSVATGSTDASAKIWNRENGTCLQTLCQEPKGWVVFGPHEEDVLCIAYSPDSSLVATGFQYHHDCKLWSVRTGECVLALSDSSIEVSGVAFSSDGFTIVTGDGKNLARVWSTSTGQCLSSLEHPDMVMSVAFSSGIH
eukprot:TRINITY_DN45444_c0_g1_i1.p1 TRINITY_DN45444_c0_g1~~TRINITY_DN45444_c0_g1_i1.p1  ORF type:complete len:398 (+),score=26.78 TRINITY_DN45444_c0_g1_i1:20-1213(+)